MIVTSGKLYDYLCCPHKFWRDIYGPQEKNNQEINLFVKLLWERGILHEEKIVKETGDFKDISQGILMKGLKKQFLKCKKVLILFTKEY